MIYSYTSSSHFVLAALAKTAIVVQRPPGIFWISSGELVGKDAFTGILAASYKFPVITDNGPKYVGAAGPYISGGLGALPVTVDGVKCIPGTKKGTIVKLEDKTFVSSWPGFAVEPREPVPGELDWFDLLLDQCVENLPLPRIKEPTDPEAPAIIKKWGGYLIASRMARPSWVKVIKGLREKIDG
jgi:hypothetical protein